MNNVVIKKEQSFSIHILLLIFTVSAAIVLVLWQFENAKLPDNVGRELRGEEFNEVAERNSPLIEYAYLSPNADFPREGEIKKITVHHMAGEMTLEECGKMFGNHDRSASSNYAIDSEGRIAIYVEEHNRAWTSSNRENDSQAVTIEVSNDELEGDWHISDKALASLIELCTDICRRNDIQMLNFTGDINGNLTIHSMFSDKTDCPGPYLKSKLPYIVDEVNKRLI